MIRTALLALPGCRAAITVMQTLPGLLGRTRVSTAWGTPNVLSVPIKALEISSQAP
jgi:hypothetical protein